MKELSPAYLVRLALRWWYLLVAALLIFGAAALFYCRLIATPKYMARASLLITNGGTVTVLSSQETIENSDVIASTNMMQTYVDFLSEQGLYIRVADRLNEEAGRELYGMSYLKGHTSVSKRSSSMVLDIYFTASDPTVAVEMVNAVTETVPGYIQDTFLSATATVLTTAKSAGKTYPDTPTTTIGFGLAGAVLTYVVILLIDFMDRAIAGEESYASNFDVPLLGTVPYFDVHGTSYSTSYDYSRNGGYSAYERKQ